MLAIQISFVHLTPYCKQYFTQFYVAGVWGTSKRNQFYPSEKEPELN